MVRLFSRLPVVPAELLVHEGPRYTEEGRRWIPKSIFRPVSDSDLFRDIRAYTEQTANISGDGLTVTFDGAMFFIPHKSEESKDLRSLYLSVGDRYVELDFDSLAMTTKWNEVKNPDQLAVVYLRSDARRAVLLSIKERWVSFI